MCFFGILEKFFKKQRGDPLKNFVPHRTNFDLVTLTSTSSSTKSGAAYKCGITVAAPNGSESGLSKQILLTMNLLSFITKSIGFY